MTKKVRKLQRPCLRNPFKIEVATKYSTVATSSGHENSLAEASTTQGKAIIDHPLETFEDFFNNLSSKIQQGLESKAVDLGALAERLVISAIYWLCQKHEVRGTSDDQPNALNSDFSLSCAVAKELNKLLLMKPKYLVIRHPFEECSSGSTGKTSENIVREHELQIFFRMEILRSPVRFNISESMKEKFVKHISFLLERIECYLDEGFYGDLSIENYIKKIITNRYCQSLGDVVNMLYKKMDWLAFDDNDSVYFNSNDPVSVKNKLDEKDDEESLWMKKCVYVWKLLRAEDRRKRDRRFLSSTSWVPDFYRVSAPKRKYQSRESNDMVCEMRPQKKRRQRSDLVVNFLVKDFQFYYSRTF